jgi:hypothetical protein
MRGIEFTTLRTDLRGLAKTLAIALAVLVAIDAAMWAWDPFGLRSGWEIPWVDTKIEGARRVQREQGSIDVMLLSTSLGLSIDVGLWSEALGGKHSFYNASMGGGQPDVSRMLFENVYYPEFKPRRLIYLASLPGISGEARVGPHFQTVMGRRLTAVTLKDKAFSQAERFSYLFRCRRQVRRLIVKGGIPVETRFRHDEFGSNYPVLQRQTPEKIDSTKGKLPEGTAFTSPFRALEDGQFGELLKLAEFCRAHGVEFVLASQPVAPCGSLFLKDPGKEYGDYYAALDACRAGGSRVVRLDEALQLGNQDFYDPAHANRFGGFRLTEQLYEEVVRPWFEKDALVRRLPEWVPVPLYHLVPGTDRFFYAQQRRAPGEMAFPLQIVTQEAGAQVALGASLPPGAYLVDIYGTDEATTRTAPLPPGHELAIEVTRDGSPPREVAFEMSREDVVGVSLSRVQVALQGPSALAIKVLKLRGPECILDSLFIRRRCAPDLDGLPPIADILRRIPAPVPLLVSNGSFEYENPSEPGMPVCWKPYSPDGLRWGEFGLSSDAKDGKRSLKVALIPAPGRPGAAMAADIPPAVLRWVLGRTLTVRVWAKSETRRLFGGISVRKGDWTEHKLPPYTTQNRWQQLEVRAPVPPDASAVSVLLGAQSATPVLYDGLTFEVSGADDPTTGGPR